jgi:hypothetical protein
MGWGSRVDLILDIDDHWRKVAGKYHYTGIKKGVTIHCEPLILMAGATRLELATSGVTGYSSGICISIEIC